MGDGMVTTTTIGTTMLTRTAPLPLTVAAVIAIGCAGTPEPATVDAGPPDSQPANVAAADRSDDLPHTELDVTDNPPPPAADDAPFPERQPDPLTPEAIAFCDPFQAYLEGIQPLLDESRTVPADQVDRYIDAWIAASEAAWLNAPPRLEGWAEGALDMDRRWAEDFIWLNRNENLETPNRVEIERNGESYVMTVQRGATWCASEGHPHFVD